MPLTPSIIQPALRGPALVGAAVSYWSPTALGLNDQALGAGATFNSSVLFVAGLNSFMGVFHTSAAPGAGVSLRLFIHRPSDESEIYPGAGGASIQIALANVTDQIITWGDGGMTAGWIGDMSNTGSQLVWWLFRFQIGTVAAVSWTVRLFGGKR